MIRTFSPPLHKDRTISTSFLPSPSRRHTQRRHSQAVAVHEQTPSLSVPGSAVLLKYRFRSVTALTHLANSGSAVNVSRSALAPSLLAAMARQPVVQTSATSVLAPRGSPVWSALGLAMQLDVTTRGEMCRIGKSHKSTCVLFHQTCLDSLLWLITADDLRSDSARSSTRATAKMVVS